MSILSIQWFCSVSQHAKSVFSLSVTQNSSINTFFFKCCKFNYCTFACELHNREKEYHFSFFNSMILISLTMQDEINHAEAETSLDYDFITLAHLGIIWQWLIQDWLSFLFQLFLQWNQKSCTAGICCRTDCLLSHERK